MKISVLQTNLQQALKTVSKAISTKPQLPILSSVLLTAENNTLYVAATDLYLGMKIEVAASIEQEGVIAVPGKMFVEAVSSLAGGKLTLELQENTLHISSDTGAKLSVAGQTGEDFPDFPVKEGETVDFPTELLAQTERYLAFSTATDQARLVLTTILFQPTEKGIEVVATDGFRLAVMQLTQKLGLAAPALIPAKALSEVVKLAEAAEQESIAITLSEAMKQVFFSIGGTVIYARLVEGQFPPYQKIMPNDFHLTATMDAETLQQHLKQASVFARDISNVITFSFTGEEVQVEAKGSQGTYVSHFIPSSLDSSLAEQEAKIAFNVRYVLDFLSAVKPKEVTFQMNESLKPAQFTVPEQEGFVYVVMPFRLNE